MKTLTRRGDSVLHCALDAHTDVMENWVVDYVTAFRQGRVVSGTVLHCLCRKDRVAAIEKLFPGPRAADAKLSIDDFSNTMAPAVIEAAAEGHVRVLTILLDAGANIELIWGRVGAALMAACAKGRLHAARELASRGGQLSCSGPGGSRFGAIDQAKHHPEIAKWLKETLRDRGCPEPIGIDQRRTNKFDGSSKQLHLVDP